jgi:hypothetical protein
VSIFVPLQQFAPVDGTDQNGCKITKMDKNINFNRVAAYI